jgi:hypothetical protein
MHCFLYNALLLDKHRPAWESPTGGSKKAAKAPKPSAASAVHNDGGPELDEGMYSTTLVPDGLATLLAPDAPTQDEDGAGFDFTNFSRVEAEAHLESYSSKHKVEGAYCLRPSSSCSSGFVLSARFTGRTKHVQIDTHPGEDGEPVFHFRGMEVMFGSIRELVDNFSNPGTVFVSYSV